MVCECHSTSRERVNGIAHVARDCGSSAPGARRGRRGGDGHVLLARRTGYGLADRAFVGFQMLTAERTGESHDISPQPAILHRFGLHLQQGE
jgi:hypothetical protein